MHKDKIAQIDGRLDLQFRAISELARRVDALYAAMAKQNEINRNNDLIGATFKGLLEQLHRETLAVTSQQAAHDERIQAWSERWRGMGERIERTQGSVEDLLKRFEAWKVTGNELGQQVDDHHKVLNIHTKMFDDQIATNERITGLFVEARGMLDELLDVVRGKLPEDQQETANEAGSDQGRPADGDQGAAGPALGAGDGADPAAQGGVPGGEHRHDEPVLRQAPPDDKG
jgi:hypothetical protein